jgi:HAD superfamily phosphoserine phosphatase-like hydrolase
MYNQGRMRKFAAVVFDIDETLAPTISWTDFTKRLGAASDAHSKIYNDYREGRITYLESKVRLLGLWHSTGNANRAFIEETFASMPLSPDTLPLMTWLHQMPVRLCLISGSIDVYVHQVAQTLQISDAYANTRFIFDDDDKLVDYDYVLDQSAKKLQQLQAFCTKYKLEPRDCAVVGDSENDYQLFAATSKGILIGANPALKPVAWRTARSLKDVRRILEPYCD